ncbi:major facilitator superfamily domain-containing protein 3-like [Actinia tenebrosa]|uniref:Major facilitator superfamily domain-containing protein 3-like n=1 Tax=Actinia tenebrosa TaxID=6105 RepID=A0A6P8IWK2_ACTTE|nr:major facilitator superfamily domain-containing protein 3-like [Actinia tenebrosa]
MAAEKFVLLFFLYFSQGLPYGIQTKLIPILLRTRSVSLSKVGFSRFLSFPWLFKVFIAKYLDSSSSIWYWLTMTFVGMAVCCGASGLCGTHLTLVVLASVFGLNVMAASQDIAVDTMAIRILHSRELGKGNIAQVVGYKVGALTGGGLLVWMSAFANWEVLFIMVSCFYLSCAVYSYKMHLKGEPYSYINTVTKQQTQNETQHKSYGPENRRKNTFQLFKSVVKTRGFVWIVAYVFVYKLGEQGMASMVPLFLLDNGFSPGDVGLLTGILAQFFSIFGSTMGGWMASGWNTRRDELIRLLKWISIARLIPMVTHCLAVSTSQSSTVLLVSECILQLTGGIITTITFTVMMQFSKDVHSSLQATHFSMLATVEVLGKLTMMSLSGGVVDVMGYSLYFLLCFLLSLGVIPMFIFCDPDIMVTRT